MLNGLTIRSSNRIEILAEQLTRLISQPAGHSLTPEVVLVQSRGMQRWLSLYIAQQTGIAANIQFPFPNTFLNDLFEMVFPDLPSESLFEPSTLLFRIMRLLPDLMDKRSFESLGRYLQEDDQGLKRYQLSEKLADLYDQYLVFRPDMIMEWEAGGKPSEPEASWQAELWRRLSSGPNPRHRARLQQKLIDRLTSLTTPPPGLPQRVFVFGVSYLPPYYLRTFAALAHAVGVEVFVLNPSPEYWGDIMSDAEIQRTLHRHSVEPVSPETLYLESGNRLLASLGKQGRDFLNLISELDCQWIEDFQPLPPDSLLGMIQSDMYQLRQRKMETGPDAARTGESALKPGGMPPVDQSIQIHSCHSPLREIEVLHDRLLAIFESEPDLTTGDIVVMTPDIEAYAPYIRAVFETRSDRSLHMPFSIADQTVLAESRVVQSFLALLNMKQSRFPASQILDLLQATGIRRKFGLSEPDIDTIQQWIEALNIRWGKDAESRHRLSLPKWSENTWTAGLQRLLLGYALSAEEEHLFEGILPYGELGADEARILGLLIQFIERLSGLAEDLVRSRTLENWRDLLLRILDQFIEPDQRGEHDLQILHDIIDKLGRQQSLADFDAAVECEVVRTHIEHQLSRRYVESGFLTGGITFCAMLPMRSIPFKVVCLIGMNSGSFPRESHSPGFDLIRRHPRSGDRQRRNDDRYLFLEALLAARSIVYISYVGQDICDNSRIPPSVLVSELLAYLEHDYTVSSDAILVQHPLHAFSTRYFDSSAGNLFSYSKENYKAVTGAGTAGPGAAFFDRPLETVPSEFNSIEIGDLSRFFNHPARYFLQKRLHLYLRDSQSAIPDSENFSLNALVRYSVQRDLLADHNDGRSFDEQLALQRAKGSLPAGAVGDISLSHLFETTTAIKKKRRQVTGNQPAGWLDIDLTIEGFSIVGRLEDIYPAGLVRVHCGRQHGRHILAHWIYHLALGALPQSGRESMSYLIFSDGVLQFDPVADPMGELSSLLTVYRDGLRSPLPLFPHTSLTFARLTLEQGQSTAEALQRCRSHWLGSEFSRGEIQDVYFKQCFENSDPLDERFMDLARTVFEPVLGHMQTDPDIFEAEI